jgi:EpsI family protein
MRLDFKFTLTVIVLAGTAVFLASREGHEVIPPRLSWAALPSQLGVWRGTDVPISSDVLDVLGRGDFLFRAYQNDSSDQPYIDLFTAYFPSQRTGDTIHSPGHCLPGSGWVPLESSRIMLAAPGRAPFPVNRYLVAKGSDRTLVLYWYWAHDRAVASEYWAKFYLVKDAMCLNRSDGAMIRISTPLQGESAAAAQQRLIAFAQELVPLINSYAPP